jgi:hypothetical protein
MHKSQRKLKQQDNFCPSKANSTTKGLNTNTEEKISSNEFQNTIVKIINELKKKKLVSDLKEDVNKQLNELRENTNR